MTGMKVRWSPAKRRAFPSRGRGAGPGRCSRWRRGRSRRRAQYSSSGASSSMHTATVSMVKLGIYLHSSFRSIENIQVVNEFIKWNKTSLSFVSVILCTKSICAITSHDSTKRTNQFDNTQTTFFIPQSSPDMIWVVWCTGVAVLSRDCCLLPLTAGRLLTNSDTYKQQLYCTRSASLISVLLAN